MYKNFLKKLFIVTLELAIIAGALLYIAEKKGIKSFGQIAPAIEKTVQETQQKIAPFPQLTGQETKTFIWEYKNKKYSLDEKLYQSVYEYYNAQPKEYSYAETLPQNWEEEYYGLFLKTNENDKTLSNLAADLQALGKKNKLTDDQIVDLTLAFVQSIPYDDAKAKEILAKNNNITMLYPYETLWEKAGMCSDKSLLAYALLKEMGYGAALFIYEDNNHMAVAVECPKNYSTYSSGYCYAETTSVGNKIGIIPSMDADSNRTVDLLVYSLDKMQNLNLKELGQVKILLPSEGKQYAGIIETEKISNEIDQLRKSMEALLLKLKIQKKNIKQEEDKLKDLKNDLDDLKNEENVEKYNATVEKFNDLLEAYKKDAKKYNNDTELYNQYVQRYNVLIKQ